MALPRSKPHKIGDHISLGIDTLKLPAFLIFTRRRSFAEYWKFFVARFNDVHAFGFNSAGSERIWMKFGVLRVYCLELTLKILGAIRAEARVGERTEIFFGPVNNARVCRFPVTSKKDSSTTSIRDDFTACCITLNVVSRRGLMTSCYNLK